ncbi:antiviral reverse transcriptase Drt3a [Gilvimarinus sp. F26214L]|uniref:antiviral reverse transcriptase Drt3a n=1 Tax=Gilvimarinus sp. DZF01 TaxID=3461371 RepID=UPI0040463109
MYDQSFTKSGLGALLRSSDFSRHASSLSPSNRLMLLERASSLAKNGFDKSISISAHSVKGKVIVRLKDFAEELVLRKAAYNIQTLTNVKQADRNRIVANLILLLEENIDYRVYRLDIRKFFESVDTDHLVEGLRQDPLVSRPTYKVVSSFFDKITSSGYRGLPRGLALSSVLCELIMRDFDGSIREQTDVFCYARFVDDMILITSGKECAEGFIESIEERLPKGLYLNKAKTDHHLVTFKKTKKPPFYRAHFDFLGYRLEIEDPQEGRNFKRRVSVDIADKKLRKIKTRGVRACIDYLRNPDFGLLLDRFRYLSSNHPVFDPDEESQRLAGIYYNYRHVTFRQSKGLPDLDRFFRGVLLGRRTAISKDLYRKLSRNQRAQLLSCRFTSGFAHKPIYNFGKHRLEQIVKCWKHV